MANQKRKFLMPYISVSKMLLEGSYPKRKFHFRIYLMDYQKKEILMAYISNLKMLLPKITKKENFLIRKLHARKFRKMPENS